MAEIPQTAALISCRSPRAWLYSSFIVHQTACVSMEFWCTINDEYCIIKIKNGNLKSQNTECKTNALTRWNFFSTFLACHSECCIATKYGSAIFYLGIYTKFHRNKFHWNIRWIVKNKPNSIYRRKTSGEKPYEHNNRLNT